MATVLLVMYGSGRRGRCDAACHNGGRRRCPCVCGGAYHGLGRGSLALAAALLELQPRLLMDLSILEQTGACRIVAWREALDGPLIYRSELIQLGTKVQTMLWPIPPLGPSEVPHGS